MEIKNKVKTLEVSAESQKRILAMMLYDKTFLKSYKGLMKPEYFDYQVLRDMAEIIIGSFEKYSRTLTEDEFLDELDAFMSKSKKRNKNFPAEEYFPIAEEVLKMGREGDFNYTRDKVVAFVKRQAMNQAIIEIPKKLKMEDYEGIALSIQEAARVGDADEAIGLKEINLEEVKPESVSWLWRERIPEGKLTYVVGDPGVGKSFLMASFIKYVTAEEGWPEYEREPKEKGSVILLNAEDGLADTIVRRLQWAGADRSKVTFIEATIERNGEERLFKLDRDIPKLEESIKAKNDVKLIVIDPLSAYLGKVDSHKDNVFLQGRKGETITLLSKVRKILNLVVRLAENPHLESLIPA